MCSRPPAVTAWFVSGCSHNWHASFAIQGTGWWVPSRVHYCFFIPSDMTRIFNINNHYVPHMSWSVIIVDIYRAQLKDYVTASALHFAVVIVKSLPFNKLKKNKDKSLNYRLTMIINLIKDKKCVDLISPNSSSYFRASFIFFPVVISNVCRITHKMLTNSTIPQSESRNTTTVMTFNNHKKGKNNYL